MVLITCLQRIKDIKKHCLGSKQCLENIHITIYLCVVIDQFNLAKGLIGILATIPGMAEYFQMSLVCCQI